MAIRPTQTAVRVPGGHYYGWVIVVVGSVINGFGSMNQAVSSVLFLPLTAQLGVGHGSLAFALSLARLETGVIGPVAGWVLDRRGPRLLMTIGCLMGGTGLMLLPFVDNYLMFVLLYMGLISVGFNIGFAFSLQQVANVWFVRHRTRVLSIFSFSIRAGRAILVPLLALATARYGWQTATVGAGIAVLVFVLPLTAFVKHSPEAIGQRPDGAVEPPLGATGASRVASHLSHDFTLREGMRTRTYWIIVFSTVVRTSLTGAVQGQLIPIVVAKGMSQAAGAGYLGLWAVVASGLLLAIGYAADRTSKVTLMATGHVSSMCAMLLLLFVGPDDWALMLLFVVLVAFQEGMAPANLSIIGDMFGRSSFGRINGMMNTFTTVGVIAAPFLGYSYDRTGDYTLPLATFAAIAGIGAVVVLLFLRPPTRLAPAVATEVAVG